MRETQSDLVHPLFVERWSTRQYSDAPVPDGDFEAMLEAARWAPSSFNAQPWHFVYSATPEERDRIAEILVPANQAWADSAPRLAIIFSRKRFTHNDRVNGSAAFDAGSAWVSFALQAHVMGYSAHAMKGFDHEAAFDITGVPKDDFDVMCVLAVGRPAEGNEPESRSPRKERSEMATPLAWTVKQFAEARS
ncbi:MAG: nitroreductase [Bacteroidetes bacterium CG12_big_fil_rev_8_21_14_0_65_60_17]|nr:MAG: nitroreductase [Bacteroidetes bacterium CG12_big_fil_rev_8_21_14_0_65_60_17]